jgi:outer membrane protein assembly factor BamA
MPSLRFFRSYLFILAFIFGGLANAQLPQHFSGLARTQVQYLVDQHIGLQPGKTDESLTLRPGSETSLEQALTMLRQQLVNLPAITQAVYQIDSSAGKPVAVNWEIEESRTVFPLLNLGGVKDNFFYLLGVNDIHFRGRGQQLTAFYQNNDGEHNYYVGLANAAFRGSPWGYQLESRRYAAVEPVYFPNAAVNYRYANLSFGAGLSYTTPTRHIFRFGGSNFYEHYRKVSNEAGTPGPDDLRLNKALLKFGHGISRVDQFGARRSGTDHQSIAQVVFNLEQSQPTFLIAWHDFRFYRLLGRRGNLAGRFRAGISSNENSPFAPFVLDSQVNIRGSGNRIDRGTAQLILNLEYRHTVWKDHRERFAAQFVGFSDFGSWRNPGGRLEDVFDADNFRHFIGGGLRLISLKAHNALVRIDYGFDVRNVRERGIVIGFGQYF